MPYITKIKMPISMTGISQTNTLLKNPFCVEGIIKYDAPKHMIKTRYNNNFDIILWRMNNQ